MGDFSSDSSWSSKVLRDVVAPEFERMKGGGKVVLIEDLDSAIAKALDIDSGIDALYMNGTSVYGIASRCQRDKNYRTFTVRKSRQTGTRTEYAKRSSDMEENCVRPHYQIQAYVKSWKESGGKMEADLLGFAVARCDSVIKFISDGHAGVRKTTNADFYYCKWDKMRKMGYGPVVEFKHGSADPREPHGK